MGKFRFAVMGAGYIARKFCDAVKRLPACEVTAVASKSKERAKLFADQAGVPEAYDSYEEMLKNERPDCVYIAVTPNAHFELSMLCLDYGVPVLCEKAMFLDSAQAEAVFQKAAQKRIFVMEAMWSRFLPAVLQAKKWIEEGQIGGLRFIDLSIGCKAPYDPENRYFSPKLGGGAAFDLTVYAYEITTFLVEQPLKNIQVEAVWGETGVDVTDHLTLTFETVLASLTTTLVTGLEERIILYGDCGKIVIPHPHYAEEAYLYRAGEKQSERFQDETENGFIYEVQEVMDCIQSGEIQSSVVPHELTLECARIFDRIMATQKG